MSTTTTDELIKCAQHFDGINFDSVYSLDTLPTSRKKNTSFIVNLDTSNLQGSHWIAVCIRNNIGFVFDPLGREIPLKLSNWLSVRYYNYWSRNKRQVQPIFSNTCGQYCIYFLFYANQVYLQTESCKDIIDIIFPIGNPPIVYENIVLKFYNLFCK